MKNKFSDSHLRMFYKSLEHVPLWLSMCLSVSALIVLAGHKHVLPKLTDQKIGVFTCAMAGLCMFVLYRVVICAIIAQVKHMRFFYSTNQLAQYERIAIYCLMATNPFVLVMYLVVSFLNMQVELVSLIGMVQIAAFATISFIFHGMVIGTFFKKPNWRLLILLGVTSVALSLLFFFAGGMSRLLALARGDVGVQDEQVPNECFAIKGMRNHQELKRLERADAGNVNIEKPEVQPVRREGAASTAHFSAADAFVIRQSQVSSDAAQVASDMNDVMDEMLNRSEIPADYAETMVALFRDKSRGDVIRDFAVQHIGLYAETLNMRGKYDADSAESAALRDALWDAAEETRTIVAVAAFRALADMAAFDPRVDAKRLDSRLASCVADVSASPATRVMTAQLCGERRVASARASLATIAADRTQPEPLRLAAANSAKLLAK